MKREVVFIYARAANGTIGRDGTLPWHIPADLKHFKRLTMGKPMIMGRKTFESLGRPLPGRRHIVLTRDTDWRDPRVDIAHAPSGALALAGDGEVAVIGGAQVYAAMMDHADRIELTEIHADYEGDTHLPPLGPEWREVGRENHAPHDGAPGYAFVSYVRAT
jgi:dihydrofolate reductase